MPVLDHRFMFFLFSTTVVCFMGIPSKARAYMMDCTVRISGSLIAFRRLTVSRGEILV